MGRARLGEPQLGLDKATDGSLGDTDQAPLPVGAAAVQLLSRVQLCNLQDIRLLCPSLSPGDGSNSCPLSR